MICAQASAGSGTGRMPPWVMQFGWRRLAGIGLVVLVSGCLGGGHPVANGRPRVDGPSVPSVNATWRSIDSCGPPASVTVGVVTTVTATCPHDYTVETISVADAGHQWPGGMRSPLVHKAGGIPAPSTALDATDTTWQFFAAHHR